MLDINWIRKNPEDLDQGLKRRNLVPISSSILNLDFAHRKSLSLIQNLQRERNRISNSRHNIRGNEIKSEISNLKSKLNLLKDNFKQLLFSIPNILDKSVPEGNSDDKNIIIRSCGEPRNFEFKPLSHSDLGKKLRMMDFDLASRISGSRFVFLMKELALLERALTNFMLNTHTQFNGYTEVSPPYLVREESIFGTAHLPKFFDDFFCTTDKRWLIPTAEVPLTNLVRESTLFFNDLPKRFVASSPCFRSEAGSYGKESHGMIRQHQFNKVELVSITEPNSSYEEHERMINCSELILKKLNLPYRLVLLCSGNTGFSSSKTYDLEVWAPGENKYIEIASCSNCLDYQARRLKARFGSTNKKESYQNKMTNCYVHTLNCSGVAIGRTLVAILENYQQDDGSIIIPEVLYPYTNGIKIISSVSDN